MTTIKRKQSTKEDLAAELMAKQQRKTQVAELEDLEIKARYWKAQFEIRDYTLKAEAIQPAYTEYLEKQKEINEELRKQWEEQLKKLGENGINAEDLLSQAGEMTEIAAKLEEEKQTE